MYFNVITALAAALITAQAATLPDPPDQVHTVTYQVPTGQNIIQFAGTMHVPKFNPPSGGYYYLWPGLYLPNYGGVLQPVLAGSAGRWTINNTWYYATNEDPDHQQNVQNFAFDVSQGDGIRFNMQLNSTWTSTLSVPGTSKTKTNAFSMIGADKSRTIPYAVFEVELWSFNWDFGPLTFTDITIVSAGTDPSWCNDHPGAGGAAFQATGATPTIRNGRVTCSIKSMVLQRPT